MKPQPALALLALALACTGAVPGPTSAAPAERPARPAGRPATRPIVPAAQTTLAPAPLPAPVFDGPFALGINEAVAVPGRLASTMALAQQAVELAEDAKVTASVGARFVRGHTGNYPRLSQYDVAAKPDALAAGDAWVTAVQGAGLEPVLMVSPWPGNETGKYTQAYLPADMAAYSAYVTRVVERYDGDGVDDMPGLLHPVRYWEVDNEVDLKNANVARGATVEYDPKVFCTPAEYAQVLIASSKAIKAAFPGARVLNAGLYRPHAEQGASYFRDLVAIPGVLDAFDVLSVHTYHDDLDGERLAIGIRNLRYYAPLKPTWVTETSLGLADGITAEDQARMVVTFVVRSALEGADKVFWHTLGDPPTRTAGGRTMPMTDHSLFRLGEDGSRVIKPTGEVYRNLAAFLVTHDLDGCLPDGPGAVKLKDGTTLLYEGTRVAAAGGGDLRTGAALATGATATAPAWLK